MFCCHFVPSILKCIVPPRAPGIPQITFHSISRRRLLHTQHWVTPAPDSTLQVIPAFTSKGTCSIRSQPHPRKGQRSSPKGHIKKQGWQETFFSLLLLRADSKLPQSFLYQIKKRKRKTAEGIHCPLASSPRRPAHVHTAHARARALRPVGPEVDRRWEGRVGAERGHGWLCPQVFSPR